MNRLATLAVVGSALLAAHAHAEIRTYITFMDGASEFPPVPTPGTGSGTLTIDTTLNTMRVQATFQDLVGTVTVAHIHGPTAVALTGTAGVMTPTPTFPGFPVGVTSGSYDMTFDMTLASSYNPSFVTAQGSVANARAVLFQAVADGKSYLNIHTTFSGSGEIRGFWVVPAPAGLGLLATAGLLGTRRRRA